VRVEYIGDATLYLGDCLRVEGAVDAKAFEQESKEAMAKAVAAFLDKEATKHLISQIPPTDGDALLVLVRSAMEHAYMSGVAHALVQILKDSFRRNA
jgi:hypothetical protein